MRALALLLVLSLQILSLPTRGDAALLAAPDVPCLSEGADPGDDDSGTLRRHQAGTTCFLTCGVVFCEVPDTGFDCTAADRTPRRFLPVPIPTTPPPVSVLRC